MPLRVAFDLDGTIADMHQVLRIEAEKIFGLTADAPLSRAQQTELWDHVKKIENFWDALPEMEPRTVERIAELASTRRWEVIFLTTRPIVAGDTVQRQTQRWLHARGFELPSVFVVQRSRGRIADALELDAVVDDRAENCLDVALDSKATAILVWRGEAQNVPLGVDRLSVRVVSSISQALDVLIKLDSQRQPSVARTLRRLFGKERPA